MNIAQLEKENQEIAKQYKDLLRSTYRSLTEEDKVLIRKAFDLAVEAHKNQRRKSGEPYIYHPIAVAKIVANEIGLGATSISCALMHDVVEDADYTLDDIEKLFGTKIAKIIDGLTKISVMNNSDISIQSENFKKLILTLSEDIRVIIVKIADRLHNMRTLEHMPKQKQLKIASETTFIYAPLAHRLGLYNIKSELEDLSLKFTDPESYFNIVHEIQETQGERAEYIQKFSDKISERLKEEGLNCQIKGRPKAIHSIDRKMKVQGVTYEEVFDKLAIRIIYKSDQKNEKFLAWKIYSIVTDIFKPNPKRLRDWITQPKSTGYESLHITVIGPDSHWVEVQIRSERMDEIAEKGIAAHYKYKENNHEESKVDEWITQVREVLEQQDSQDTTEFIDNFKLNFYAKEIYVFTPQGDIKSLPKGATSLDFAYSIHTNVGDTCLGAKVNGKLYPLSYQLNSGDQVEVLTSPQQKPKPGWLDFVITSRAKSKIKASLNAEKRQLSEEGREIFERKLRHLKINLNEQLVNEATLFFKEKSSQNVFLKVQSGDITNSDIKRFAERSNSVVNFFKRFRPKSNPTPPKKVIEETTQYDLLVFGNEEKKLDYALASCCNPIPGDKVFGFITVNRGITVHKDNCPNAVEYRANYAYRIIKARWVDSSKEEFNAIINLKGIDRMGMINDITNIITQNHHINMKSINISSDDGIFNGRISVEVKNKDQLDKVLNNLKKLDGIKKVRRQLDKSY